MNTSLDDLVKSEATDKYGEWEFETVRGKETEMDELDVKLFRALVSESAVAPSRESGELVPQVDSETSGSGRRDS